MLLSFNSFWRFSLVYGLVLLLFFLSLISFSIPMTEMIRPYFILMAIYYWAVYRPTLLNAVIIFFLGIFYDLILGFPLALHAALFLIVHWIIRNQRTYFLGQSYVIVWIGFIITCFSVLVLEYIFFSIYLGHILSFTGLLNTLVLTSLFYPLITLIFSGLNRILPLAPKSIISVD